jgi:chromosome segregation ATPase
LAQKWAGHLPGTSGDSKQGALRAEAEAACAQALGRTHWLRARATRRQLDRANRQLRSTRDQLEAARQELSRTKQQLERARRELQNPSGRS